MTTPDGTDREVNTSSTTFAGGESDDRGAYDVDLLIDAWYVVTMNATRDIIHRGSVAVRGNEIVAVGKTADLERRYRPARRVGGDRFVLTPGLVNTHIHITGEPITRGYVPDDTPFEENVFVWLCQLYAALDADDERCSAQLAAAEMLRSGTTTFLEAGTIRFLDEVLDGLTEIGIRGRVGRWIWDLPPEPTCTSSRPTPRSRRWTTSSAGTVTWPTVGWRRGRRWSGTPPVRTRCGGPVASWLTSTAPA
jgi:hypothetical protein